ncbi:MAG: NAD-dependent epimerase/dehydratase family protein [Butyricicoccus sp.]
MKALECPADPTLQEDLEKIAALPIPWGNLNHSTILITGATGLIGSQLVRAVLAANRIHSSRTRVLALVRSPDKAAQVFGPLLHRPELELLTGDITNPFSTKQGIDYIFHTASITTSRELITRPVDAIEVAVSGTKNILDLAKETQCRSMVYLSSMEVYGTMSSSDNCRTAEDELGYIDLSRVRSCYPEGKRLCENLCVCYAAQYGVPVKIARLAQTFGAGVSLEDPRVFAQFARAAMAGENIILHTAGRSNGNYCYTADAVAGLLTILLRGKDAEAYNVVSERATTTIAQMAQMVSEQITGGKSRVVFDIPDNALTYGYAPDVKLRLSSKKLEELGWSPCIAPGLVTMYERLLSSFQSQRDSLDK